MKKFMSPKIDKNYKSNIIILVPFIGGFRRGCIPLAHHTHTHIYIIIKTLIIIIHMEKPILYFFKKN